MVENFPNFSIQWEMARVLTWCGADYPVVVCVVLSMDLCGSGLMKSHDFGGAKTFGRKQISMVSTRDPSVYFLLVILFFSDHQKKNHRPKIFSRSSWSPVVELKNFRPQSKGFQFGGKRRLRGVWCG